MSELQDVVRGAVSVVTRPFREEPISEGVVDVGGPTQTWVRIFALKLDGTHKEFTGTPTRSNLNTEEMRAYLADYALDALNTQIAALLIRDEQIEHIDQIHALQAEKKTLALEIQKTAIQKEIDALIEDAKKPENLKELRVIRSETKDIRKYRGLILHILQTPGLLGIDGYIFDNVLLIHLRKDIADPNLLDFATVDVDTKQQAIVGFGRLSPAAIKIDGRERGVMFFQPLDPRPIQAGGPIQLLHLRSQDEQTLLSWIRSSVTLPSFLKVSQELVTEKERANSLQSVVDGLQQRLAQMLFDYNDLKGQLKTAAANFASRQLSLIVALVVCSMIGFGFGTILYLLIGPTTVMEQVQAYNFSAPHNLIGTAIASVPQQNPVAPFLPGIFTLIFGMIAIGMNSKRWKIKKRKAGQ